MSIGSAMIDLDELEDQLERVLAANLESFRPRSQAPEPHERAPDEERFWRVLNGGDEDEHYELLDECRRRAYTYGELRWRGALTLLLAHLGRRDEAVRELEATVGECESLPRDAAWLDIVTKLAEAASLLGDVARAKTLRKWLAKRVAAGTTGDRAISRPA